jgi:tetratricopeptide (TPR) repeat protein
MIPRARDEARKSLELAPSHPLGHAVLGIIAVHHDYNWPEAEDQFRHVATAEFVHPNVHLLSLFYLLSLGRFDAALAEVDQAIAQDPLNSFWRARRAWVVNNANRYDESLAESRTALECDATNYQARMMMALSYTCQGNLALSREAAEAVYRTAAFDAFGTGLLGGILSRLGEKDRAEQVIATMTGAVTIGMTIYHLVAGEIDAALDWYKKDIEAHRPNAPIVAFAAWLAPMRASPRWAHVAGMMNLPRPAADMCRQGGVIGSSIPASQPSTARRSLLEPDRPDDPGAIRRGGPRWAGYAGLDGPGQSWRTIRRSS